ncbi:MAG: hypothetical protein MUC57_17435, partial [Desulfobacterales bacterium]|nr:hypothetical protein [Desulfobacterales bacterium]
RRVHFLQAQRFFPELLLTAAQVLFRGFHRADVGDDGKAPLKSAVRINCRPGRHKGGYDLAAFGGELDFIRRLNAGLSHSPLLFEKTAVLFVHEVADFFLHHFSAGVAQHFKKFPVGIGQTSLRIRDGEAFVQGLYQRSELIFALGQFGLDLLAHIRFLPKAAFFGFNFRSGSSDSLFQPLPRLPEVFLELLADGDVPIDTPEPAECAVFIKDRHPAGFQDDLAAGLVKVDVFQIRKCFSILCDFTENSSQPFCLIDGHQFKWGSTDDFLRLVAKDVFNDPIAVGIPSVPVHLPDPVARNFDQGMVPRLGRGLRAYSRR